MGKFKIGDRVRVLDVYLTRKQRKYVNKIGTIIDAFNPLTVSFDDRTTYIFHEHKLELVPKDKGLSLKEALESGRSYRREGCKNFFKQTEFYHLSRLSILANDWELEPIKEEKKDINYIVDDLKDISDSIAYLLTKITDNK